MDIDNGEAFRKKLMQGYNFRLFLLLNLPSAWLSGLHLHHITHQEAEIRLSRNWFNKNPFRSVYFAVLQMAAEVSTGVMAMTFIQGITPGVSMLVIRSGSEFYKKATGKLRFICTDGAEVRQAVNQAILTGESSTVICKSRGYNETNELVAECWFQWSFRQRKN